MTEINVEDVKAFTIAFVDAIFIIKDSLEEQDKPMLSIEQLRKVFEMAIKAYEKTEESP
jgi:hypothetical protein